MKYEEVASTTREETLKAFQRLPKFIANDGGGADPAYRSESVAGFPGFKFSPDCTLARFEEE